MLKFVAICALIATSAYASPLAQESQPSMLEEAYDIYASCSGQDLSVCLKMKALGIVDRVARSAELPIVDGVKIVKTESSRADNARSLNDIAANLPAEPAAREAAVDEAIAQRTESFLNTHTVEVSTPEESGRSLNEARKKKKSLKAYLIPLLFLLKFKAFAIAPLLIGGLAILALKALVAGKLALIISGILALQKLLGGHKGQSYEVVHPVAHDAAPEHHGWARAYSAQKPQ